MTTPDAFFTHLENHLVGTGLRLTKKTPTGRNVYTQKPRIEVTVNYVPSDNRVSVKCTINRGTRGGPTPLFDELRATRESASVQPNPKPAWSPQPDMTESKVETKKPIGDLCSDVAWVVAQATILRVWVGDLA